MLFLSQNITGSRLKYNGLYGFRLDFLLCYMCLTALVISQITI